MNYETDDDRAREAYIRECAHRVADLADWRLTTRPELLPRALRDHLYEPSAHLVLIPWAGGSLEGIKAAVSGIRCTALVLQLGTDRHGIPPGYFTLARCADGNVHMTAGLRLWVSAEHTLFLVPDPDGEDRDGVVYALSKKGIMPAETPWSGPYEHGYGVGHADTLLLGFGER